MVSRAGSSRPILATRVAFFIAGALIATWAPMVPFVKHQALLSDGTLGVLLLTLGLGAMLAMPLSGSAAARFGCRAVIVASSTSAALLLPSLVFLPTPAWLFVGLPLLGFAVGMLDVTMNIQAVMVQRRSIRPMMSGFHAFFSIGGFAGAGGASFLLQAGLSHATATLTAAGLLLLLLVTTARHMLAEGGEGDSQGFALPRGPVLLIGIACLIVFLTEGAMLDWGALFLNLVHSAAPASTGFGYAAFASAMTLGRLLGDRIVRILGARVIILAGGICAALGVTLAMLPLPWPLPLAGFLLIGLGCANIVPVLFTAAGNQSVMPANQALAAVTTVGYAGVLVGPAVIGFIAQASSLRTAFACIALALIMVAFIGPVVGAKEQSRKPA
ncbi:MFS transporter [Arboricoccus pini]